MQSKNKIEGEINKYKMPSGFHVEIDRDPGGITASVSGVISIIAFDECGCVLKVRKGRIGISGNALKVSVLKTERLRSAVR